MNPLLQYAALCLTLAVAGCVAITPAPTPKTTSPEILKLQSAGRLVWIDDSIEPVQLLFASGPVNGCAPVHRAPGITRVSFGPLSDLNAAPDGNGVRVWSRTGRGSVHLPLIVPHCDIERFASM